MSKNNWKDVSVFFFAKTIFRLDAAKSAKWAGPQQLRCC